jgi:hypothetical protein
MQVILVGKENNDRIYAVNYGTADLKVGAVKNFKWKYRVPKDLKPGIYRFNMGFFKPDWSQMIYWAGSPTSFIYKNP